MQTQSYLQGFLQHAFNNTNIYTVFCNAHAKTGLPLFVVWSCRRNVEEPCSGYLWLTALNLESDNPGICQCWIHGAWKSGNMGSRNENSQNQNLCRPKCRQGLGFIWGHCSQTEKHTNKIVFAYFPCLAKGPYSPGLGSYVGVFDETCFAGNDSSIVDHALSGVRNHTDHAKGYGSALRVFSKSMNWSLGIWWLLRCAIRETEWAHKVNGTFGIPEGNYRVHTAFPKPDLSGLWVWTPN